MGYLIFKGVNSDSLPNVLVSKMPSHRKASQRFTEYYVKGRDGALHVNEGFANFDITATLVTINANASVRQTVNSWANGTGKLITSDDTEKAYIATVEQEVEWTRVQANDGFYDSALITFNCQPFMVEAYESSYELTASGTLVNIGTSVAYPLIEVIGSGDASFTFAGYPIEIDDMDSNTPVFIDCETGYVYTSSGSATIRGDIPELAVGSNTITLTSNVTKMIVTPRWRWI